MEQSLVKNYIHIVFGTKHRESLIYLPFENNLHRTLGFGLLESVYEAEICYELKCSQKKTKLLLGYCFDP